MVKTVLSGYLFLKEQAYYENVLQYVQRNMKIKGAKGQKDKEKRT
jgi:hypothetical protein